MLEAIHEAEKGLRSNKGGPFGAVIVCKGKIVAKAHNEVLSSKDPTAHAEINAIRRACKKLKRFHLEDCEIYSTCEPCSMCFSAIRWARLKKLYYGCTSKDAHDIGFDDKNIYDEIKGKKVKGKLPILKIQRTECMLPLTEWMNKKEKKKY